jgi:TM2 domain-containing membrane protein YozV
MAGLNIAPGYYHDSRGAMRWWDGQQWAPQVQQSEPQPQTEQPLTSAPNDKPHVPAKNPSVAVLLSLFLPGTGNLYAGSKTAGVVLLISWFVSWFLLLAGIPAVLIVWVVATVTAHSAAVKFNQRNRIGVR